MDSNVNLVGLSSKLQQSLSGLLRNMPILPKPSNFFDSLQSKPEIIKRRVKSGRNPNTGLLHNAQSMSPIRPSTTATKLSGGLGLDMSKTMDYTKLNTRVIEGWINSTLTDAEYLDIPGCIMKPETKLPLVRFGVDRASLINAGIQINEIDSIYQSLFVHSIAFYQTIAKMFEHTEKKYTIITGLWKVYAILLEYCCKLDYKMIITTLNIEKKAELDELEANYNNQIGYFEENQRILEKTLNDTKEQVRNLQRKLDFEIQKKEELEDELMQKGSGHEEEVSTRIQFESKVNQMYAKQRDMETKALIMEDTIEDLKKNVEAKSVLLLKEKKNYENIFNAKERIEAEYRRADELNKLLTISNTSLENRLNEAYVKVEDLTNQTSKLMAQYSEAQNALTRKKIEVEDKNFELDLKESTITKLSSIIEDLKLEKNVYVKRVVELENLFSEECDKNQHYKQEYTRIKESDNFYAVECMKNKDKADSLEVQCEDLKEEKNKFKIQLESLIQSCEEFKVQLKKSQERIEEMNKGRRMVEEQNEFLNSRLSERVHELKDARSMNLELKDDVEKLKTKENSLESEVTTLTIKLRSLEKQYDANKDTMQGKINSLSDILSTEKQIRENWIFKFEEEQKSHSTSSKLLVMTQDQQNELQMKFNSNLLLLDEKTQKIKMQMTRISEQLEEILELKAFQEELQRKNKTLQMLYEDSEKERLEMIQRHLKDIEVLNGLHEEAKENLLLGIEEIRVRAWVNLEKFMKKTEDFNELEGKYYSLVDLQKETADKLSEVTWMWNRQSMCSEDLSIRLCGTLNDLFDLTEKHEDLSERFETVTSKYLFFISLIPEHLKDIENPFGVLTGQIEVLEEELRKIEYFKSNMVDFEVQFDAVAISLDENTQTDIGFSFFEKNRKMSGAGTPHSGSQRVYSAKSKEGPSTIHEYQGKSRDRSFPQKLDSGLREETPINMASVYNQSFKHLKNLPALKASQNALHTIVPAPPEIKRLIKTANSRRKQDTNFL